MNERDENNAIEMLQRNDMTYCKKHLGDALIREVKGLRCNMGVVEALLAYEELDVNYVNDKGETALTALFSMPLKIKGPKKILGYDESKAIRMGIAKRLIERGADVNIHDQSGCTAPMIAIDQNVENFLPWGLKEGKIDPNFQSSMLSGDGVVVKTPTLLMCAVAQNKWEVVNLLLDYKADPDLKDAFGRTALMLLMQKKGDIREPAKLLINAMSTEALAGRDKEGKTAVSHFLAKEKFHEGDLDIAHMLVEKVENCFKEDIFEKTSFQYFLEKQLEPMDVSIAEVFIKKMSSAEAKLFFQYTKSQQKGIFNGSLKRSNKNIQKTKTRNSSRLRSGSTTLTRGGTRSTRRAALPTRGTFVEKVAKSVRSRVGSTGAGSLKRRTRAGSTPKELTPREKITTMLEVKKRGSFSG